MNIVKNTRSAYGLYALVFVVAWVGALALGMPGHILVLLAIVALCPLMLLMMGGMHGDHGDGGRHTGQADPPHPRRPGR